MVYTCFSYTYGTYMQVNARICNYMEIDATSIFPYKNTCIYVQYVHIRATYVTTYVHIRTFKIQLYVHIDHIVFASICMHCMYMNVYATLITDSASVW